MTAYLPMKNALRQVFEAGGVVLLAAAAYIALFWVDLPPAFALALRYNSYRVLALLFLLCLGVFSLRGRSGALVGAAILFHSLWPAVIWPVDSPISQFLCPGEPAANRGCVALLC